MNESEGRTKPGTSTRDEARQPRPAAEGLAAKLLWASDVKARVVATVMNNQWGPGASGIADDFGVAVEMALKARVVFRECGPWNSTARYREMEEAVKRRLGHDATVILGELPPEDVEAVKKLYDDSVDEHRVFRPDVPWADFDKFMKWVGRAVEERYHPGPPRIPLPVGGAVRPDPRGVDVQIPSFADRLIEWVRKPMEEIWKGRTRREMLDTNYTIAEARAAEATEERSGTIRIPLMPGDAETLKAAAKASGAPLKKWARRALLDAARRGGQST